ncbi:MAG TPA: hypothetical protein VGE38_02830 [Nocardioides sp.]|uniref:hypothetical protein n=1 Tax=Nocardioides sp. TaxID=35761 RepID=UPI002ED8CC07
MTRAAPRRRADPAPRRRAAEKPTRRWGRSKPSGEARGLEPAYVELPDERPVAQPAEEPVEQQQAPTVEGLVAEPPPRPRPVALEGPTAPVGVRPEDSTRAPWQEIVLWVGVIIGGLACLAAGARSLGPDVLPGIGSVAIATAYTWVLCARTGGRPVLFTALAAALGAVVLLVDLPELRTGASVVVAAIAAVLGVVITVPAVRFRQAARECCVAVGVAWIGALAALGLEPTLTLARFEYAVLLLALGGAFLVVYRLGAGLHGLGRRGVVIVAVGGVTLLVTLLYAEMLRRYGTEGLIESLLGVVHWSRENLGAFPRPIETVLGIPALAWGVHMRARRRQGWWVCAFGVAATAAVSDSLVNPAISVLESVLSVVYGLVGGLLIGYLVIRLDLFFTGSGGGRRAVGRRGRRAEEAENAVRPEPKRTDALL